MGKGSRAFSLYLGSSQQTGPNLRKFWHQLLGHRVLVFCWLNRNGENDVVILREILGFQDHKFEIGIALKVGYFGWKLDCRKIYYYLRQTAADLPFKSKKNRHEENICYFGGVLGHKCLLLWVLMLASNSFCCLRLASNVAMLFLDWKRLQMIFELGFSPNKSN